MITEGKFPGTVKSLMFGSGYQGVLTLEVDVDLTGVPPDEDNEVICSHKLEGDSATIDRAKSVFRTLGLEWQSTDLAPAVGRNVTVRAKNTDFGPRYYISTPSTKPPASQDRINEWANSGNVPF